MSSIVNAVVDEIDSVTLTETQVQDAINVYSREYIDANFYRGSLSGSVFTSTDLITINDSSSNKIFEVSENYLKIVNSPRHNSTFLGFSTIKLLKRKNLVEIALASFALIFPNYSV